MGDLLSQFRSNFDATPSNAVAAGIGGIVLWYMLTPVKKKKKHTVSEDQRKKDASSDLMSQFKGHHTILRQAMLAYGGACDHGSDVKMVQKDEFDLNATIFKAVPGIPARAVMASKLAIDVFWNDDAASRIAADFAKVPMHLDHNKNVLDFMQNECNFVCEHAEGSFMDHLQFVYDYGKNYYREESPRVLLLHSIMGVATNIFPMEINKLDKLQSLVTDTELKHIQAFPSMLRLILQWRLIEELRACSTGKLATLKGIRFHRVLDNKPIELGVDDFWVHLNYHMIHFLDFLPAANWKFTAGEITLQAVHEIHTLLTRANKMFAKVDLNMKDIGNDAEKPMSLANLVMGALPANTLRKITTKNMGKFSHKIGHSLEYELLWA